MKQQSTETFAPADSVPDSIFDLTQSLRNGVQLKGEERKRQAGDQLQSLSSTKSNLKAEVTSAKPLADKRDAETSTSAPFECAALLERFVCKMLCSNL